MITKRTEQDKIEIVGTHKIIQVRTATIIGRWNRDFSFISKRTEGKIKCFQ